MSAAATTARASDAGAPAASAAGWFASAMQAMHLTTAHHETRSKEELAQELLERVRADMGDAWGAAEEKFCDAAALQRYLRARSMDVTKAAAMLKGTLEWRKEFGTDDLRMGDYDDFIREGWVYLLGNDDGGNSVMMLKKRRTRLEDERIDNFIGFLVLLLESSVRNLKGGAERWTWVFDMANYDSRNSPKFEATLRVLTLVANHYPERLNKVFIIDAPTIFWVLFKAVCPFLDPVTKSKVEFVYSKDVKAAEDAASEAAAASKPAPGAGVTATITPADTPAARFMPYLKFYRTPFDYASQLQLLSSFGWRK